MDFHGLTRRELQTLCKKNKIPANMTNIAMADALAPLQYVEGLDELMNQSSQSQEKVPETPSIVNRTKPTNEEPKTAQPLTCTCRSTRRPKDQENKNVAETPAASTCTSRRKTQVAGSSVRMRTRQSVRLLEKTMAELSLKDKARAEPVPVKMDFLDQTHMSDNLPQKYNSDDDYDNKKANTDEIEPVDVSVTENVASVEVMCKAEKVSDEISVKVTGDVDVEADQREDQIIASRQLGRKLDFKNLEANSNKIAPEASDTVADDDSDPQKLSVLIDKAESNQVASKESASDADADDDSDYQKSLANQQDVNLIAVADSNQFSTESIIAAEAADVSASDVDADDDSGSQKFVADQLDIQTTAECVEELVDVSLMEDYKDEIPNSNSVKQISPSSAENTMKNLINIYVMPAEEFGMASPATAKQTNDCHSRLRPTQSASNQMENNKENIDDSSGIIIMNVESKKDKVRKSNNIVDNDSELKSLNEKSLRQLNKILKEKLQISHKMKKNGEENITKKQVGNKPRPALQTLPENQMLASEPNNEN